MALPLPGLAMTSVGGGGGPDFSASVAVTVVSVASRPVLTVVGARPESAGGWTDMVMLWARGMNGMTAVPAGPVVAPMLSMFPLVTGSPGNRSNVAVPVPPGSMICALDRMPGCILRDHGELGDRHGQGVIDGSGEVNICCAERELRICRVRVEADENVVGARADGEAERTVRPGLRGGDHRTPAPTAARRDHLHIRARQFVAQRINQRPAQRDRRGECGGDGGVGGQQAGADGGGREAGVCGGWTDMVMLWARGMNGMTAVPAGPVVAPMLSMFPLVTGSPGNRSNVAVPVPPGSMIAPWTGCPAASCAITVSWVIGTVRVSLTEAARSTFAVQSANCGSVASA